MSSAASSSSTTPPWPPQRPSKRSKLRNGTWIVPSTGQRTRRQFSLRTVPSPTSEPSPGDRTTYHPLFDPNAPASSLAGWCRAARHNLMAALVRLRDWLSSAEGHGVLKCTLAYLLGSAATFVAPLSNFLGTPDGKHIVATITVYFHPARTAGSMLDAVLISAAAVSYAEAVSVLSMALSVLFRARLDLPWLAHALVVGLGIGVGLGFLGWTKQRLNSDLGNVASTLASIAIISVVTKEDAVHGGEFSLVKIIQVLKMLVMGIVATAAVNLLLWRVDARHLLRKAMGASSQSLGDMLSMIARGFLNGSEAELHSQGFVGVEERYKMSHAQVTKYLREAKFEYYFLGREAVYRQDKVVVRAVEALAQAIGGLRSASNTQFALLRELPAPELEPLSPGSSGLSPIMARGPASASLGRSRTGLATLASIDETEEHESMGGSPASGETVGPHQAGPGRPMVFHGPSDIFELFIRLLGPSMKSLAHTLAEILRESPFGGAPAYDVAVNEHFSQSLGDALGLYNAKRAEALHELYRAIELGRSRTDKIQADIEEVAAACGHFSFTLQSVAEDMAAYLESLADLRAVVASGGRTWTWLRFWRYRPWRRADGTGPPKKPLVELLEDPEGEALLERAPPPPVRRLRNSAVPRGIPDAMTRRRDTFSWEAAPQASRLLRVTSQKLLRALRALSRDDIRFGVKVGLGAAGWAVWAFVPATRPTYQHWRGEWGLLSFMIVCSMTVGASNTTSLSRFVGTLAGALLALVGWHVTGGNGLALAFLGWLISLATFYVILVKGHGPLGRVTLLAWNVTALYAYSLSRRVDEGDEDEGGMNPLMAEIVGHRIVAVTLGILWGMVVCRGIWPISGRKKFKEGLAVLYLQMGLIWRRGPLAVLLRSDNRRVYIREGEQEALQRYASKLETLRTAARSEFELRGPFPDAAYRRVMQSTQRILDGFHAMRLVTTKRGRGLSPGERNLLAATAPERAQLCDLVCLVFQVLASSLMLEYPLTDAIPSIEAVKDRLLKKIYAFRVAHARRSLVLSGPGPGPGPGPASAAAANGSAATVVVEAPSPPVNDDDEDNNVGKKDPDDDDGRADGLEQDDGVEERDYALLYAYTLVTVQVGQELKAVQGEIEGLFGVLDQEALLLQ